MMPTADSEGLASKAIWDAPELVRWDRGEGIVPLEPDQVRVWVVELDCGTDQVESEFDPADEEFGSLSADEVARALRFVRVRDRLRFARCRSVLRELLGLLLVLPPGSLRFRPTGRGKPELEPASVASSLQPAGEIRFNVSHSANLGLIAVARGREVGVDIEQVRPIREAERIVASYFTADEQMEFGKFPAERKDLAFHRGWTRKEAIIKAEGTGLGGLSVSFETHFGANDLPEQFELAQPFARVKRWILWEAAPAPGFVAAVAVDVEPLEAALPVQGPAA